MFLKHNILIILLIQNYVNSFDLFGLSSPRQKLNEKVDFDLMDQPAKLRWIEQKLDHFDKKESRTWKMRYFERLDLWKSNGPIYLYIGGAITLCPWWAEGGSAYELAKETNGAIFLAEHRYYGQSLPYNNTDNVDNLKFLSSRQALADLSVLLKDIKLRSVFKKSKVVVIGGSYAGNLATWMRLLYPELVDAAYASSAPVLAKVDFYEFLEKVSDDYERYGTQGCFENIKKIFKRYDTLLQTSEGIETLKKEKNICEDCDMTVSANKQYFFIMMMRSFMGISTYGSVDLIKYHCKEIENISEIQKGLQPDQCYSYDFKTMLEDIRQYKFIPWIYQMCTEFGFFTITSKAQAFTDNLPVSFFIKVCTSLFGDDYDERRVNKAVERTNNFYGGRTPNVTNIVFTNGELDPLSNLSVLEDLSDNAPAIVIPQASNCRELYAVEKNDPEELTIARQFVKDSIKRFIGIKD